MWREMLIAEITRTGYRYARGQRRGGAAAAATATTTDERASEEANRERGVLGDRVCDRISDRTQRRKGRRKSKRATADYEDDNVGEAASLRDMVRVCVRARARFVFPLMRTSPSTSSSAAGVLGRLQRHDERGER
jgi:hypothetical protein